MDLIGPSVQALRLREDPDFRHDLEHLMRAVWNEFREPSAVEIDVVDE